MIEVQVFEQHNGSKLGHGQWRKLTSLEIEPFDPNQEIDIFAQEWDEVAFGSKRGDFFRISDGKRYVFMGYPEDNNAEDEGDPYHYMYIRKGFENNLNNLNFFLMEGECLKPDYIPNDHTYVAVWRHHNAHSFTNISMFLYDLGFQIVIVSGAWYIRPISE